MKATEEKKLDGMELTDEDMEKVSGGAGTGSNKATFKCEHNHKYNEVTAKRYRYICPLDKSPIKPIS